MELQNSAPNSKTHPMALADRSRYLRSNIIRDLLAAANRPGMIALGGGNPAPESFPVAQMSDIMKDAMTRYSGAALQYSDTAGFAPLRETLAQWLSGQGILASARNILITAGSQSGLDLLAKLLINENSPVVVESPTYLGALQAFSLFAPKWRRLEEDNQGPMARSVRECIRKKVEEHSAPLMYIMPTFRNPTGTCWHSERKAEIRQILAQQGNWIIEDDPYRLIHYEAAPPLPMVNELPRQTIYLGTLSKVFAPGLRLGYCVVPDELFPWLVKVKQGTDLNTGTLSQALAAEYLSSGRLQENLPKVVAIYRRKRDALAEAIRRHLWPWFQFELPTGGMFLWVKGPPAFDSLKFLETAMHHGVFFVPGNAFYSDAFANGQSYMRLNFSGVDISLFDEAAKRLRCALEAYFASGEGV